MNKNKELTDLFNKIEKDAKMAKSESDLILVIQSVSEFLANNKSLKYNLKDYVIGLLILILSLLGYAYYYYKYSVQTLEWWIFIVPGCLVVGIIVLISIMVKYSGRESELSDYIFEKDVLFDNEITELPRREGKKFEEAFGDFVRGDEGQSIVKLCKGVYQFGDHAKNYHYYEFKYVVVTHVPVPVSNGKGGTTIVMRRQEDTYYRYGIIVDFNWVKGILVKTGGGSHDYKSTFETGLPDFNKIFEVGANSQQDAAKFLKPTVILAFVDAHQYISDLSIEINNDGKLCISYSNDDTIDIPRKSSLADPTAFMKEISQKNLPPRLGEVMKLISIIEKHNDKNF